MDEAERAFWSVAVQLSAVLGLAIVLETRLSTGRFNNSSRASRLVESGLLGLSGVGISLVGVAAIFFLAADRNSGVLLAIPASALSFGLVVAVINPVLSRIGLPHSDTLVFVKAFMPWSEYRKDLRERKKLTAEVKKSLSAVEKEIEESNRRGPFVPSSKEEAEQTAAESYAEILDSLANLTALARKALQEEAEQFQKTGNDLTEMVLERQRIELQQYRSRLEQRGRDGDSSEKSKAPPPTPEIS